MAGIGFTVNYNVKAGSGLGPRTLVVKCAKSTISQAEINECATALQMGGTYSGVTNDAFTIAGVSGAAGDNFVLFAVQGTGTLNADASNALGVSGVTLTIEATFAPAL